MAKENDEFAGLFEEEKAPVTPTLNASEGNEFSGLFEETPTKLEAAPEIKAPILEQETDKIKGKETELTERFSFTDEIEKELQKYNPIQEDPVPRLGKEDAVKFIRQYEKEGKDSGWEVRSAIDMEGKVSETVIRKSYLSAAPKSGFTETPANRKKLNSELDGLRYKELSSNSNMFEQAMEGLTKPTEQLMNGMSEILGGDPDIMTPTTRVDIPFEHLSLPQKAANVVGTVVGYAGPGTLFNAGVKGIFKAVLSKTGKEALVKEASKSATKFIGKQVAKDPTTAKIILGQYAGKMIKNGPSLAAEGAAWEFIASGGDPEAAVHGALLFPVAGVGLSVAGSQIKRGFKKIFPKEGGYLKEIPEGVKTKEQFDKANLQEGVKQETNGFAKQFRIAEDVDDFLFSAEKFPSSEFQGKIKTAYISSHLKAQKLSLQLKLQDKVTKLDKVSNANIKEYAKVKGKLDKKYASLSKQTEGAYRITSDIPKSINDIKGSFGTKSKIESQFGTLEKLKNEANLSDEVSDLANFSKLSDLLRSNGFTQSQVKSLSNQLLFPETVIKKLTATQELPIKYLDKETKFLTKKLGKIQTAIDKFSGIAQNIKRHPTYMGTNIEILKKMPIAERRRQLFYDDLVAQGLYDPLTIEATLKKNAGFKIKDKSLLNQTERWNRVEEVTGVPIGQVVMDLIEGGYVKSHLSKEMNRNFNLQKDLKVLRNMEANGKDLFKYFHYVERDPKTGKVGWNPEAFSEKGFEVPHFSEMKLKEPTDEVKNILFKFREMTDWAWRNLDKNEDIGYLQRYIARQRRVKTSGPLKRKAGEFKQQKAGFLLERKLGNIKPEEAHLYEMDLYNLMPSMMRNSVKAASYSKALDSLSTADTMLRFMGMDDMSNELQKYAKRALGVKSTPEAVKMLSTHALKSSSDKIEAMITMVEKQGDQTFKQDVINAAYDNMYHSYLGLSPGLLKKQLLQPEIVGSAEVGYVNVLWSQTKAYSGKFAKESRTHIERVKDRLYPENFDYDMMGEVQRNWIKNISEVSKLPGKPGFKLFTHMDKKNRETMFLAGRRQLQVAMEKGETKVATIMEDLLDSEKNQIVEAFKSKGRESALDTYGLIRAKRSNFAYSMAERSELFSEGLGAMVPFVHWGANQWMRHLEDLRRGPKGIKSLAKRVGYAWATIASFQYLTNEQFYFTKTETAAGTIETSSALPTSSMLGLSELSFTTVPKAIMSLQVLPGVRAYSKIKKALKKKKKTRRRKGGKKKKKKVDPFDLFRFKKKKKKKKKRRRG